MLKRKNNLLVLVALLSFFGIYFDGIAFAQTQTMDVLERIPVQSGGRIKPFQSFAQETLFYITGKRSLNRQKPTYVLWQWMSDPEKWKAEPFVPVAYNDLKKEFGLMLVGGKTSPEVLLNHRPFTEKVEKSMELQRKKEKLFPVDQKRLELYEKASLFRALATGDMPGWVAQAEDPVAGWLPFGAFLAFDAHQGHSEGIGKDIFMIRESLQKLLTEFRSDPNSAATEESAIQFSESLQSYFESHGIVLDQKVLNAEITYNHLHPFGWAWKFYAFAVLVSLIFIFAGKISFNQKIGYWITLAIFMGGFLMHTYGFYLRCVIAGRPPVSNMYESIIWVSWSVCLFALFIFASHRALLIPVVASSVAGFALILAEGFPTVFDPAISPLVPVLRSNLWLTIHVLTITLSYGAFALAWGLGHVTVFSFAFNPQNIEKNRAFSQYLYRALQIGVLLLAIGTVLGGVWANYSWGRFWGWDPKETWALIALLGYLAVLHGRYAGWMGNFGIAVGSIGAFLGVVMAWYGVNYVLAAGLHSYGFGGGGAGYVGLVALLDMLLICWPAYVYKSRQKLLKTID